MNDSEDLLNRDVVDLLFQKLIFHQEQAKFHQKMVEVTQKNIELLTKSNIENNNGPKYPELSVPQWRPLIHDLLLNNPNILYRTEQILETLDSWYVTNAQDELRKKAIMVISSSLHALVNSGRVDKLEFAGRGNSYRINNEYYLHMRGNLKKQHKINETENRKE